MRYILIAISFTFLFCHKSADELNGEISRLENKLRDTQRAYNDLHRETENLHLIKSELEHNTRVLKALEQGKSPLYILTVEVKQERMGFDAFDLEKQMKDHINAFTFEIPVDKKFYDASSIGQPIAEGFRSGSFVFKLSTSAMVLTVTGKRIEA